MNEAGNGFGVNEQTVAVVEVVVVAVCQSTRAGVHSAQFTEVLPSLDGSCSYIYRDTLRSRSLIFITDDTVRQKPNAGVGRGRVKAES